MRLMLMMALVVVALVVLRLPLLRGVGRYLVVTDPPAPSDAIVMLSGSVPDRILGAVDLYKAGLAPRIVLTREGELPGLRELRARGLQIPEHHETNLTIAEQLGVPRAAITVLERRSSSTIGEVAALLPELRRLQVHSLLLVTSKTHTRRAAAIFRAVAGSEFQVRVCPTPYDPFTPDAWWQQRFMTRRLVTEYGKWLTFELIDRWRVARFVEAAGDSTPSGGGSP